MLDEVSRGYRQRILVDERRATDAMRRAFADALRHLTPHLAHIEQQIAAAWAAGQPVSPSWLYERDRLARLQATINREMTRFGAVARTALAGAQRAAVLGGVRDAQAALAGTVPRGVAWQFGAVPASAVEAQVSAVQPGSPLAGLFDQFGPQASAAAKEALVTGVTVGQSPDLIARALRVALHTTQARALTIARTETMRAYRVAQLDNYRANRDVVQQWVWSAASTACGMCLAMNGTRHDLDEGMDTHANCRCSANPETKSWQGILDDAGISTDTLDLSDLPDTSPSYATGDELLAAQPESDQIATLGPAKWWLWHTGKLSLSDLVGRAHDAQWGGSRYERSLSDLGFSAAQIAAARASAAARKGP